ncbi:MAG: hypothetical protein U1F60_14020 [Planctomycetota bacterium]
MRQPFLLTLTGLAILSSCGSIPTPERLEAAEIGPPPNQLEAVQLATAALRVSLPSFATAKIAFADLTPGFYKVGGGNAGHRYAWELVAWVEAENSVGIREPAARHHFYFLGSKLVATAQPGTVWTGRGYESRYKITEFEGGGMDQVDAVGSGKSDALIPESLAS